MAGQLDRLVVGERDFLAGPEVLALVGALQAELGEAQVERMACDAIGTNIEDRNRRRSAGETPGPDLDFPVGVSASAFAAQLVITGPCNLLNAPFDFFAFSGRSLIS